jgi:hypothetical protein
MTPDELPADMEAVVARLEKAAVDPVPWPDLRALLKAYQERGRALEVARHALVCTENLRCTDQSIEALAAKLVNGVPRDQLEFMTNFASELAVIDAALNQKGDER